MAKEKTKTAKRSRSNNVKVKLVLVFLFILSAVFLPTALVLFIAMLPTFVSFFADTARKKTKYLTVGAMNISGAAPFLLSLWGTENTLVKAIDIVSDPLSIVVMYSAAALGYFIDGVLASTIAGFVYEKGLARMKVIEKVQTDLIERWGPEVRGTIKLDSEGYPVEEEAAP